MFCAEQLYVWYDEFVSNTLLVVIVLRWYGVLKIPSSHSIDMFDKYESLDGMLNYIGM